MVKKSVDDRIMEIVQKYVEKVCEKYQIKAILICTKNVILRQNG